MKYIPIIIFVILFLACGNGKGGKNRFSGRLCSFGV